MSQDALDRCWKPFCKSSKSAYSKVMREKDEKMSVEDPIKVEKAASKFEEIVARQRRQAGL